MLALVALILLYALNTFSAPTISYPCLKQKTAPSFKEAVLLQDGQIQELVSRRVKQQMLPVPGFCGTFFRGLWHFHAWITAVAGSGMAAPWAVEVMGWSIGENWTRLRATFAGLPRFIHGAPVPGTSCSTPWPTMYSSSVAPATRSFPTLATWSANHAGTNSQPP